MRWNIPEKFGLKLQPGLIRGPIPPAPGDDDDDSNDDYYPDFDFGNRPAENAETIEGQTIESTTISPAAPIMEPETAATGATTSSSIVMEDVNPSPALPPVIPSQPRQVEDEVSLGDKDPEEETMGPQIPVELPMEDVVMEESVAVAEDPLEFATSC